MANLNSGSFLNRWQILQRATMPSLESDLWHVGTVEWRRQRHAFTGAGYSFAIEVHTLASSDTGKSWALRVVVEHWWDAKKTPLRTLTWARRLSGSGAAIFGWVRDQEAVRRAVG